MTFTTILEQAKTLSLQERKELAKLLIDTLDAPAQGHKPKTGAEIVAILEAMDAPIELVDSHIEDPVEWVKTQRHKRRTTSPTGPVPHGQLR